MPSSSIKTKNISFLIREEIFQATVHYCKRRTYCLRIAPDKSIQLRVPYRFTKREIQHVIDQHQDWIIKKIEVPPVISYTYQDGESFYLLGKPYILRWVEAPQKISPFLSDSQLVVTGPELDPESIKKQLQKWVREVAIELLTNRIQHWQKTFPLSVPNGLRFRRMKGRWGSCSSKGILTFNTELLKAPLKSLDYVILHEFCHLQYLNHGPQFKMYLTSLCPDWKIRKKQLQRIPGW